MIKLLLTMVESAKVETITMDITAEKPPRNTKVAKKVLPFCNGSNKVKYSAFSALPNVNVPPQAINITKKLNNNKYKGNSQMAFFKCFSRLFSKTATWNCRGNKKIEKKESAINRNQLKPSSTPPSVVSSLKFSATAICS